MAISLEAAIELTITPCMRISVHDSRFLMADCQLILYLLIHILIHISSSLDFQKMRCRIWTITMASFYSRLVIQQPWARTDYVFVIGQPMEFFTSWPMRTKTLSVIPRIWMVSPLTRFLWQNSHPCLWAVIDDWSTAHKDAPRIMLTVDQRRVNRWSGSKIPNSSLMVNHSASVGWVMIHHMIGWVLMNRPYDSELILW